MKLQLRDIRKDSKLSQSELAERIGANIRTVGAWERGETMMSVEQLCRCCDALGCTPNDMTGWYIDHPTDRPRPAPADPYEAELVESYRGMDRIARMTVVETVRGQAALSASRGERGAAAPEVRAAGE